ncbi:hypothetical protein DPMN_037007 [Dreissena polymorpha]|uniref:Uncharacterized protein n=1 Tax=Dreissena polymorpha TaxID=45954 RepID=A0A9D4MAH4_DREPO|nr:hypothetical protein DPMN_037007 [Dreissena polymorpha]
MEVQVKIERRVIKPLNSPVVLSLKTTFGHTDLSNRQQLSGVAEDILDPSTPGIYTLTGPLRAGLKVAPNVTDTMVKQSSGLLQTGNSKKQLCKTLTTSGDYNLQSTVNTRLLMADRQPREITEVMTGLTPPGKCSLSLIMEAPGDKSNAACSHFFSLFTANGCITPMGLYKCLQRAINHTWGNILQRPTRKWP